MNNGKGPLFQGFRSPSRLDQVEVLIDRQFGLLALLIAKGLVS